MSARTKSSGSPSLKQINTCVLSLFGCLELLLCNHEWTQVDILINTENDKDSNGDQLKPILCTFFCILRLRCVSCSILMSVLYKKHSNIAWVFGLHLEQVFLFFNCLEMNMHKQLASWWENGLPRTTHPPSPPPTSLTLSPITHHSITLLTKRWENPTSSLQPGPATSLIYSPCYVFILFCPPCWILV